MMVRDFRKTCIAQPEAGLSMTETMVGVAIVGIFIAALFGYLGSAVKSHVDLEERHRDELVRQYIRTNLDCQETFDLIAPGTCGTPSSYIDAVDMQGNKFIGKTQASRYGVYLLRASCPVNNQLFFEALRTKTEADTTPGKDPLTDVTNKWFDPFHGIPPASNPPSGGILDFESVPGITEGMILTPAINEYFRTTYGVTFSITSGGQFAFARIARARSARPGFEAWMSILCPNRPNRNQLCNGGDGGRWILSTTSATNTRRIAFEINYETPVKKLSFDLADLDGNETWTFTLYNSAGAVIPGGKSLNARGYRGGNGNSALKTVDLDSTDRISKVKAVGTKPIRIFGFGFDNFVTGIPRCAQTL